MPHVSAACGGSRNSSHSCSGGGNGSVADPGRTNRAQASPPLASGGQLVKGGRRQVSQSSRRRGQLGLPLRRQAIVQEVSEYAHVTTIGFWSHRTPQFLRQSHSCCSIVCLIWAMTRLR